MFPGLDLYCTDDLYDLYDLHDLYDLAHVAEWEPYILRDLGHFCLGWICPIHR